MKTPKKTLKKPTKGIAAKKPGLVYIEVETPRVAVSCALWVLLIAIFTGVLASLIQQAH